MTITISENVEPSMIDNLLKYMQREKVPYAVQTDDDAERTTAIRERLRQKLVVTGQWATMDDEDRLDASLFESMLYDTENGSIERLQGKEALDFENEMQNWAK